MVKTVRTRDERDKLDVVEASTDVDDSYSGRLRRAAAGELVPCEVFRDPDGSILGVDTLTATIAFRHLLGMPDGLDGPGLELASTLVEFIVRTALSGDELLWVKLRKMAAIISTDTDRRVAVVETVMHGIAMFHEPRRAFDAASPRTAKILRDLDLVRAPYSGWKPERAIGVYQVSTSLAAKDRRFAKLAPLSIYRLLASANGAAKSPGPFRIAARLSTSVGALDDGTDTTDAAIGRVSTAFRKAVKTSTAKPSRTTT